MNNENISYQYPYPYPSHPNTNYRQYPVGQGNQQQINNQGSSQIQMNQNSQMNQGLGIGTGVGSSINSSGLGVSGVGNSGIGGSLTTEQLSPVINQHAQVPLSQSPTQQSQLLAQLQNQVSLNQVSQNSIQQPPITPGISTIGSLATNHSPTNQNTQINQGYYQYNYELPPIVANDWDYMIESNPLNYKTAQYPSLPIPNQQVNPMGMTYGYQTSIPSMNMGLSNSLSNPSGLSTSLPGPPPIGVPGSSPTGERKKRRNTTTVSNMTPQTAARNRCPICQKQFKRPSSLQTHIYSHTGEKLFKCPWQDCGKLFSVKSNMTRHYKLHQRDNN